MKILGTEDHILDLVNQPAFTVHAGKIIRMNQAAKSLLLKEKTPILELIPYNQEAYEQFTGGCLYLTLRIHDIDCGASVTKSGRYHIFILDNPDGGDQLQALALTGNMLKLPLSNITALLDAHYAPEHQEDIKDQKHARQLRKNAAQMYRIINNMCDASCWTTSSAEKELCNVSNEFVRIMENSTASLAHANVRLHYTCPKIPIISMVDTEKFERAIYNLVSNAVKFASGKPFVEAELTYDKEFIYVNIKNPCAELDQERFTTAFTHYLRKPSLDNARNGVGLGMVLVRSTAMIHKGTVQIHLSDPNTACVSLSLKIQDPENVTILRSPTRKLSGYSRNIALIELSDILPDTCYNQDF